MLTFKKINKKKKIPKKKIHKIELGPYVLLVPLSVYHISQ
jgi:hypothetical protein